MFLIFIIVFDLIMALPFLCGMILDFFKPGIGNGLAWLVCTFCSTAGQEIKNRKVKNLIYLTYEL